jgi:hypothetical protein
MKFRAKRFVNPIQLMSSIYNEALDRPRLPFVVAPAFNWFSDDDDDFDDSGNDDQGETFGYPLF